MDSKVEFGSEQLRLLGQRLRALRQSRDLSLRKLASESSVSVATIQDIEAGTVSPSLLNVLAIAEVLGEPVDRLIAASLAPKRPVQILRGKLPGRSSKLLISVGRLVKPRLASAVLVVPPKSKLAKSDSPTEVPMFAYVVEGTVELAFASDRRERLAANDAIHIAQEPPRLWSNPSARRAVILCVASPFAEADSTGVR